MKVIIVILVSLMITTGCSVDYINAKLKPVNEWYESEYEKSRHEQRYKFTETKIEIVRDAIINTIPEFGLSVTSQGDNIIAEGKPMSIFSREECEKWSKGDNEKTKELSGGFMSLSCDPANPNNAGSFIVAIASLKQFKKGTLIVLDYEMKIPQFEAYGIIGPRRPSPLGSKAGSIKFWDMLNKKLPYPLNDATAEDLI